MGKPKRIRKIDPYLRRITEARFQARVVGIARANGFKVPRKDPLQRPLDLVYHTHDSRRSVPGFPDLVLCKPASEADEEPGRVIFAELKRETGTLEPEQRLWLEALRGCPGVEVYVWKPRHLEDIRRILGGADTKLFV